MPSGLWRKSRKLRASGGRRARSTRAKEYRIPTSGERKSTLLDGTVVWSTDSADPACDTIGYAEKIVDISAYLGTTFTLLFTSANDSSGISDFFVDDVSIVRVP
jgi:hypothetical protein